MTPPTMKARRAGGRAASWVGAGAGLALARPGPEDRAASRAATAGGTAGSTGACPGRANGPLATTVLSVS